MKYLLTGITSGAAIAYLAFTLPTYGQSTYVQSDDYGQIVKWSPRPEPRALPLCHLVPHWRKDIPTCLDRRQSDRGIATPSERPQEPRTTVFRDKVGDTPQDRETPANGHPTGPETCSRCDDILDREDKIRQHRENWFENTTPEQRAEIRARRQGEPDKGGRERARERREEMRDCRDSATNGDRR